MIPCKCWWIPACASQERARLEHRQTERAYPVLTELFFRPQTSQQSCGVLCRTRYTGRVPQLSGRCRCLYGPGTCVTWPGGEGGAKGMPGGRGLYPMSAAHPSTGSRACMPRAPGRGRRMNGRTCRPPDVLSQVASASEEHASGQWLASAYTSCE